MDFLLSGKLAPELNTPPKALIQVSSSTPLDLLKLIGWFVLAGCGCIRRYYYENFGSSFGCFTMSSKCPPPLESCWEILCGFRNKLGKKGGRTHSSQSSFPSLLSLDFRVNDQNAPMHVTTLQNQRVGDVIEHLSC
ncbi:hypothetical protein KSP39_PZI007133 [Platanthera zijinensis]|uniref:Uncharacterized protein n=1 Tax=Platanthera zijinensis TaxID=2320716 RepID=A0AAP0G9N2_9ASPA